MLKEVPTIHCLVHVFAIERIVEFLFGNLLIECFPICSLEMEVALLILTAWHQGYIWWLYRILSAGYDVRADHRFRREIDQVALASVQGLVLLDAFEVGGGSQAISDGVGALPHDINLLLQQVIRPCHRAPLDSRLIQSLKINVTKLSETD